MTNAPVNILGVILGVTAGGGSKGVLLAAGFSAAITESISMGAVGYTSSVSERELQPVETPDILRSSVVITIATLIGQLIPLVPFVWMARTPALVLSILLSALVCSGWDVFDGDLVGD